ncbi:hypothetical protein H310_10246 [Aphanomyces invadans]|uniref:Uncharacterized protein n=1 Tax=Aphanomyces invadans TaxID=157072 RepID=A0A024TSC6_9STRA|nr:hypothetical protein H310_10246 [Aphanomyces invadans]ETV96536.1 hypothetical protein H310_10246 [Aphanomyces invadans]|eukprot:XP_008874799.1 hypothetical protein H310_10246 [Aphanomyces invadans]
MAVSLHTRSGVWFRPLFNFHRRPHQDMLQSAQVIVPSDPNSIVTGRGKCLNCHKIYLIQASVCSSMYCSLDCQSNALYMETVRGHVQSAMPATDSVNAC